MKGNRMPDETSTLPKLSLPEISALVVLMAEAREVSNPELKELTGITITGPVRKRLVDLKLVEGRKGAKGAYSHQLTDHGWRMCGALLSAERPARAGSAGGAMFALLGGLQRNLARLRMSPGDFFVGRLEAEGVAESQGNAVSQVRAAYQRLARVPGDWVSLADVRNLLGTLSREDVDQALRELAVQPKVHLIPVANLKSLSARDHSAALRLGGEDNHAIKIEAI